MRIMALHRPICDSVKVRRCSAGVCLLFGLLLALASASTLSPSETSSLSSQELSYGLMWQRRPELDNLMKKESYQYIPLVRHSVGKCAFSCKMRVWCSSFFFLPSHNHCWLERFIWTSSMNTFNLTGVSYYVASSEWCNMQEGFIFYPCEMFCFLFSQEVVSDWHAANAQCRNKSLDLVVPTNMKQLTILLTTVSEDIRFQKTELYIGITLPLDEWNQPWPSGSPRFVDIRNNTVSNDLLNNSWTEKNPNNYNNKQNCLKITNTSKVNDLPCTGNSNYICQRTP